MAATVGTGRDVEMVPYYKREFRITGLVSNETITITNGGPASFRAKGYEVNEQTAPTALCSYKVIRIKDSETSTTSVFKVVAEAGGDLTGLVLDLTLYWDDAKSGGIS